MCIPRALPRFLSVQVALLTNPIWVAKTRMQLQAMQAGAASTTSSAATAATAAAAAVSQPHTSTAGTLIRIVREEGIWGLYRGIRPSLLLVSHGAIQFAVRCSGARLFMAGCCVQAAPLTAQDLEQAGSQGGTRLRRARYPASLQAYEELKTLVPYCRKLLGTGQAGGRASTFNRRLI